jgi:hypothetical protein
MEQKLTLRPLPTSWVAKVFTHMQGHYGTRWVNMWKTGETLPNGQDAGIANAIETWAAKLGGFHDQPERFRVVLENLPATPPSLPEFVEMLRKVTVEAKPLALPHHYTPEEIARNKARVREMLDKLTGKLTHG